MESYWHLLSECREARNIWKVHNEKMDRTTQSTYKVLFYYDVFALGDVGIASKMKMRVNQEVIQSIGQGIM
jgi:hypothetical protein